MTAESQKLPSSCQLLQSTSAVSLLQSRLFGATPDRVIRHLWHCQSAPAWPLPHPSTHIALLRTLPTLASSPYSPSEHHEAQPCLPSLIPQNSTPKQYSPRLLLNSEAVMAKIGLLTWSPTCPSDRHERQQRRICGAGSGWEAEVSINLQDLMDWLCGQTFTWLQIRAPGSSSLHHCWCFYPTTKMTQSQVKENLVFHRPHFDGKTNAYYNNNKKYNTGEDCSGRSRVSRSCSGSVVAQVAA